MKILKVTGIVLLVLIVLLLGIAMLLPSEVHVERSAVIPASSEVVFNQINNLKAWQNWSPWHEMDPNMKVTYHENVVGEGASYSWTSDKVGSGSLTITESTPYNYIATSMDFMDEGTATGYYQFEPVANGTKVTWAFDTDMGNNPIGKYMGLMMDGMIGSDFEKGLQNLKTYVRDMPSELMTKEATVEN